MLFNESYMEAKGRPPKGPASPAREG